ncbi:MAG TPA: hypothetical protein VIH89_04685 [Candidatus Sulfotelmatobacter sp.]
MSLQRKCALCLQDAELCESHIIPSFFGAYLKETSATGYMRNGDQPNLRRQDLPKERLLCDNCEGRFAVLEKYFKENILHLVQSDHFTELEYNSSLLLFLVSISWRVLVTQQGLMNKVYPNFLEIVNCTLENWRQFLLGERQQPGSEQHMFVITGIPKGMPTRLHEKTLHYLLRGIDTAIVDSSRTFFVYTKALRTLIFSPLVPASPTGWIGTRVHSVAGRLTATQAIEMPMFLDFLNSCVEEGHLKPLSDKQRQKIKDAIIEKPERALASESYKVEMTTKQLALRKSEK